MNKKELTVADIRTKFFTPALVGAKGAKWNVVTQFREEIYFTKGHIIVRGKTVKRGDAKKAEESYNKGKQVRIEKFEPERAWRGDEPNRFDRGVENDQASRVSIAQIKTGSYDLDLKNSDRSDEGPGDFDHMLTEIEKLLAKIAETRAELKAQSWEALIR